MSMTPGPSLMTASPMSGWWSLDELDDVGQRDGSPSRPGTVTWARSSTPTTGGMWRMTSRWFGVSTKPPVPVKLPG